MGKSSKKSTIMTDRELEQMHKFNDLFNADLSTFGNVWVNHRRYGIIRGEITRIPLNGCKGRTEIKLENGKIIYANRYEINNHIKERWKELKIMHEAIKKQRDKNITVWISRKLHKKVQKIAFKEGVSITWVLNKILKDYFERK